MLRLLLMLGVFAAVLGGAAVGQQSRGYLGVDLQDVTKEEADRLGWEVPRGAKVTGLAGGSPAVAAGLQKDDVIAAIDGMEVESSNALVSALTAKDAGSVAKLRVMRAGKERNFTVTLGARPGALAAGAEKMPQLVLDTGGHMAKVIKLAITPDGKQLVSASNDKTVRVWDIVTGKAQRIIRGESAPGDWGAIYAMALSPDGRWLAVGGYLSTADRRVATAVRLHDFASGKLEALLKGHDNVVYALAFSPDSKRLISGSADKTAIVWDLIKQQQTVRLSGHAEPIKAVAFDNDGTRAITGSEDQTLRLWNAGDGALVAEMTEHKEAAKRQASQRDADIKKRNARRGDDNPQRDDEKKSDAWFAGVVAVAVSPTEPLIASSSADGRVLLWDAQTGAYVREAVWVGGLRGAAEIFSISFSADGRWLLSTSTSGGCKITEVASGREFYDGKLQDKPSTMLDASHLRCNGGTAFSPDGRLAAAGYNSVIHLLDANTRNTHRVLSSSGTTVYTAVFTADGRSVLWGDATEILRDGTGKDKLTRRLRLPFDGKPLAGIEQIDTNTAAIRKFIKDPPVDDYVRRNVRNGDRSVDFKKAGPTLINPRYLEISRDGKVEAEIDLAESSVGTSSSSPITFSPDGQMVIIGLTPNINAYDVNGRLLGEFVGHNGQVRDLTPSPDRRLLVSGATDQTARLWNVQTRELIVSLFSGTDGEWVMWTPQGYYTGSPGADKIVGWQINKGPENAADYIGADQLRTHLNRPDIVEKAIILASAEQAVRESPGTSFKLSDLLSKPVPRFRIVSPASGSAQRGGRVQVKIAIEAVPDPIKAMRVQVNGRQVSEITPEIGSGGLKAGEQVLDVPLGKGRNEVRITLTNAIGEKAEAVTLNHEGDGDLDKRGTLYILAIGIDRYPVLGNTCGPNGDASCDLRYSGADAGALVAATERRLSPAHSKVVKRVLLNGGSADDAPTAANIIDATDLLKQAKETDTVVVFIAGHGFNDGPSYRLLATNAARDGDSFRSATVVQWQILQEAVERAKGRRILFLDTCHSGNAYNQTLGNAAYHANIIAYTSARFDQEALEDRVLGHGIFTYAVVEGLDGKAAVAAKPEVSTKDLAQYVVKRVAELAKTLQGEQEPQYFKGRDADDYVLVRP